MFNINESWMLLKIKLLFHEGDIYRYLYLFDDSNEDNGGIIEFDCFVIEEMNEEGFKEYVSQMYYEHRVIILKAINNDKFITENGIDFAFILALFFIYKEYIKKREFPLKLEYLNLLNMKKLRSIFPNEYKEVMNMINELQRVS